MSVVNICYQSFYNFIVYFPYDVHYITQLIYFITRNLFLLFPFTYSICPLTPLLLYLHF